MYQVKPPSTLCCLPEPGAPVPGAAPPPLSLVRLYLVVPPLYLVQPGPAGALQGVGVKCAALYAAALPGELARRGRPADDGPVDQVARAPAPTPAPRFGSPRCGSLGHGRGVNQATGNQLKSLQNIFTITLYTPFPPLSMVYHLNSLSSINFSVQPIYSPSTIL
jgi:hypothetical protein